MLYLLEHEIATYIIGNSSALSFQFIWSIIYMDSWISHFGRNSNTIYFIGQIVPSLATGNTSIVSCVPLTRLHHCRFSLRTSLLSGTARGSRFIL